MEKDHKEEARLSFEEKIKRLSELHRIAETWGQKGDVIVWTI